MRSLGLRVGHLAFSQSLGVLLSGRWSVEDSSELNTDDVSDTLLESLEVVFHLAQLDLFFHHFLLLVFQLLPQFLLRKLSGFDSGGKLCIDLLQFLYFLVEQVHDMILLLSLACFLRQFLAQFGELVIFFVYSLLESMDSLLVLSFVLGFLFEIGVESCVLFFA